MSMYGMNNSQPATPNPQPPSTPRSTCSNSTPHLCALSPSSHPTKPSPDCASMQDSSTKPHPPPRHHRHRPNPCRLRLPQRTNRSPRSGWLPARRPACSPPVAAAKAALQIALRSLLQGSPCPVSAARFESSSRLLFALDVRFRAPGGFLRCSQAGGARVAPR